MWSSFFNCSKKFECEENDTMFFSRNKTFQIWLIRPGLHAARFFSHQKHVVLRNLRNINYTKQSSNTSRNSNNSSNLQDARCLSKPVTFITSPNPSSKQCCLSNSNLDKRTPNCMNDVILKKKNRFDRSTCNIRPS
jgi:hypothetical protein